MPWIIQYTRTRAAEQHIDNHGRVGVHQAAAAEGGEAEPGDCLRAGRPETQVLLLSDGIYNLIAYADFATRRETDSVLLIDDEINGPAVGGYVYAMDAGDRGNPRSAGVPRQRVLRQELPGAARLRPGSLRRAGAQRPPGHRVLRGRLLPPRGCGRGGKLILLLLTS
jgi:hypothetical protein